MNGKCAFVTGASGGIGRAADRVRHETNVGRAQMLEQPVSNRQRHSDLFCPLRRRPR